MNLSPHTRVRASNQCHAPFSRFTCSPRRLKIFGSSIFEENNNKAQKRQCAPSGQSIASVSLRTTCPARQSGHGQTGFYYAWLTCSTPTPASIPSPASPGAEAEPVSLQRITWPNGRGYCSVGCFDPALVIREGYFYTHQALYKPTVKRGGKKRKKVYFWTCRDGWKVVYISMQSTRS